MPYLLQDLGGNRFILLNRDYKPLGRVSKERLVYETDPSVFQLARKPTAAQLQAISWQPITAGEDRYWLYVDTYPPLDSAANWTAYAKRLAAVAKLKMKIER